MTLKHWIRSTFGDRRVRHVKALRTKAACKFNVGPWRRLGYDGIDVRLADEFNWAKHGTYIELGGNDGFQFSNTFLLERELAWSGVLIEGIPELAAEASRNRPKAVVVCAAITASPDVLAMDDNDRVSKISVAGGRQWVAATTLSAVIDTVLGGEAPDFISIDVEGHEAQVLRGLDLSKHRPKWILVETMAKDIVDDLLETYYTFTKQLAQNDFLYQRRK